MIATPTRSATARAATVAAAALITFAMAAGAASAQAVGGVELAKPVAGDPGISSNPVLDRPTFRVLRDYAEPGATRRMHAHADATTHVFVLITGQLRLTVEGEAPVDVTPGQVLELKGGVRHTFINTGTATATIVEVFGKAAAAGAAGDALALGRALAGLPIPQ